MAAPPVPPSNPWHALSADEAVATLRSGEAGLDEAAVRDRLSEYGPNALPAPTRRGPLLRFLAQFDNALIYFLLGSAVLAFALGHRVDAVVILLVVGVNAVVGFVQEGRAEDALSALHAMLAPQAHVWRDGRRVTVPVEAVVPGDIVLLEAGDKVPADLRLTRVRGLLVDESVLTGESMAVEKRSEPVAPDAALADRHAMAWSGTLVAAGQGRGVVVATGARTEIGAISGLIGSVDSLTTPLLRQINRFARWFTGAALGGALVLLLVAVYGRGYGWAEGLMIVVALAVSIVPEGLPAVITITLAIGVRRMASRHAIVRRLPAVETLGATSVICSDKTGTLTRNEMSARRLITRSGVLFAEGTGYAPTGRLVDAAGQPAMADTLAAELMRVGLLCNDARLHEAAPGEWRVDGDPMEGALLALAARGALDGQTDARLYRRLDEIPFDTETRYMATLHAAPHGGAVLFVKGAPERVLAMCSRQAGPNDNAEPLAPEVWQAAIDTAGADGERVLGFAWQRFETAPERLDATLVADLVFAGLIGFIDPPRAEAIDAVAECRSAGIDVKMITGDHAATAGAIAAQLGMAERPAVVTGADVQATSDADLPALAERTTVFARTTPEHKLRIVRALQSDGSVVAMTGDGVNDAPSLKQADVGIAMGNKGTEAAKEAAQVVLTDDNFATIVAAVREGRTVYDNIRKVIAWTLPTNGGQTLAIAAALVLGMTLPVTAVQILWINMVLAVSLGLSLAFEPAEPGVMQRQPRAPDAPLLSPFMLWRVVFVSILFVIAALGVFAWARDMRGLDEAAARTLVVNVICVLEIFYLFNVRYLYGRSITPHGARGTPAVLLAIAFVALAQFAFTYLPWMQLLFDTRAVALADGLVLICVGVAFMVILEIEKALLQRLGVFKELSGKRAR
ncbi:HAD-IC family P-type ATPase [Verticiella sediminum]|uniref:HAD-IC family P-type ATPase n=1 Tax=Verticiella sediminum TaxID=1247510 RepID=A0A556AKM1_9BURK|nr:HAD-IC family P-type ATPase [Verticiella sediminum]TSH93444.1 HAD-IC family P-type ATPase [Verticiella sediminum]